MGDIPHGAPIPSEEERYTRNLYGWYLECGIPPEDALERLALMLVRSPGTFTRMVPVLDSLREKYVVPETGYSTAER